MLMCYCIGIVTGIVWVAVFKVIVRNDSRKDC